MSASTNGIDCVIGKNLHWNIERKKALGERFLRMADAADVAAARALWKDPHTPVHRRCLAARAIGLLGKHGPSWLAPGVDDDESPLGRARRHGTRDARRRQDAERRSHEVTEANENILKLGAGSVSDLLAIVPDPGQEPERRVLAASALAGLRCRDAVEPLIRTLAEGHSNLSSACAFALIQIGSRRGSRQLIEIARVHGPLPARQEAIYALWWLGETRAESLFLRLSAALETEEEYTRDMATEALGNTRRRPRSQRALAERLFDPSVSVRFAALCAVGCVNEETLPCLRRALVAKLADPEKVDDDRVIAVTARKLLGPTGH